MKTSKKNIFLKTIFWLAMAIAIMLALFVLAARIIMENIDHWQEDIVKLIQQHTGTDVDFASLEGKMQKIYPVLKISKLSLSKAEKQFLYASNIEFRIDIFKSLFNLQLIFDKFDVVNMGLWLEESQSGWNLAGFKSGNYKEQKSDKDTKLNLNQAMGYLKLIFLQNSLKINNLKIYAQALDAKSKLLFQSNLEYANFFGGKQLYSEVLDKKDKKLGYLLITKYNFFIGKTSGFEFIFEIPKINLSQLATKFSILDDFKTYNLEGLQIFGNIINKNADFEVRAKNLHAQPSDKLKINSEEIALSGNFYNNSIFFDYVFKNSKIIDSKDLSIKIPSFSGRFSYAENKFNLKLSPINLDIFTDKWNHDLLDGIEQLKTLQPKGTIAATEVSFSNIDDLLMNILLKDVDVKAWQGAPGMKGLTAWITANTSFGRVIFKQDKLNMHFPELFNSAFELDKAQGIVDWEVFAQDFNSISQGSVAVNGRNILLEKQGAKISGNFNLLLPGDDVEASFFDLNLGLADVPYNFVDTFLPEKIMDRQLVDWVKTATRAGEVKNATLWIAESYTDKRHNLVDLSFDIDNASLKFMPDWPQVENVKGLLNIKNGIVHTKVHSGNILGANIERAEVNTFENKLGLWLNVWGKMQSKASIMQKLFRQTPLMQNIPKGIRHWRAGGVVRADLDLKFPLEKAHIEPYIGFFARFIDTKLNLVKPNLFFEHLNGTLSFDVNKGFYSKGMSASLWGDELSAKSSKWNNFTINANLTPHKALEWLGFNVDNIVLGKTKISGNLNLDSTNLHLESNLENIKIDLPAPFAKVAQAKHKFNFDLNLENSLLKIKYLDKFNLGLKLDAQPLIGIINIADKQVDKIQMPPLGLFVAVKTKDIIIDDWLSWSKKLNYDIPKINFSKSANKKTKLDMQLKIDTQNFVYQNTNYKNFNIIARNQPSLEVAFVNPYIKGDLTLNESSLIDRLGVLDFKYIKLPENLEFEKFNSNKKESSADKSEQGVANFKWLFGKYAPLDLNIDNFEIGKAKYGAIKTSIEPDSKGLKLSHLELNIGQTIAKGFLDWRHIPSDNTRLKLDLEGGNLGVALKNALGNSPLQTSEHKGAISLAWQDAPHKFSTENLAGNLDFNLLNGQFPKLDIGGLKGLARVFSLFNIDTILRRLSLDFSDLTSQGLTFTDITGSAVISHGVISTISPINVKTTATSFTLEGEIDLIKNFINQELVIVVPVSQTLPIIALLAGSTQVGLAIWAAQKLFGNFFDDLTKARYKIYGDLNEPELKLMQIF